MNVISLHLSPHQRHLAVDMWGGCDKPDQYVLLEDTKVELPDGRWVTLFKGDTSDVASVPQSLWSIYPPYNNRNAPAFWVHDKLYERWEECGIQHPNPRYYADVTMLQLLLIYDPTQANRHIIFFWACRLKGGKKWHEHRKTYKRTSQS